MVLSNFYGLPPPFGPTTDMNRAGSWEAGRVRWVAESPDEIPRVFWPIGEGGLGPTDEQSS